MTISIGTYRVLAQVTGEVARQSAAVFLRPGAAHHSTPHCAFLLFQLLVLRLLILCRRFSAIGRPRKAHDPCHKLRNLPVTAAAADIISRPTRRQRPRHHALRRFAACQCGDPTPYPPSPRHLNSIKFEWIDY